MKKIIRPFIIEHRSKRGRSRLARVGEPAQFADHSAERSFSSKGARDELSAWLSLFKQEERSPR